VYIQELIFVEMNLIYIWLYLH